MVIEKPQLFSGRREFLLFVLLMLLLIAARLLQLYANYRSFLSSPFHYTTATVCNVYPKTHVGSGRYSVLKLHSEEGWYFFTTSYGDPPQRGMQLRLQLHPGTRITFWKYLGGFYCKSRIKARYPVREDAHSLLRKRVAQEHRDSGLAAFYQAVFFAVPVPPMLREQIARLGVSHLVALSGFHLGILWAVVYGVLRWFYRPLQQRYFPYRYTLWDIGAVTLLLLGWYVYFVGAPPSLLRAYAMLLVGWVVTLMGIRLLSFTFLTTVVLLLLLLFPTLILSLGFWLSVAGVFYVFLLLRYADGWGRWTVALLWVPLGIFILMLPIVHTFFDTTTPYQLLSPLLSLLFVPFYPLTILLHLMGRGDLFDTLLGALLKLPGEAVGNALPLWATVCYLGLSLWAIWSRRGFGVLMGVALLYAGSLFVPLLIG